MSAPTNCPPLLTDRPVHGPDPYRIIHLAPAPITERTSSATTVNPRAHAHLWEEGCAGCAETFTTQHVMCNLESTFDRLDDAGPGWVDVLGIEF